MPWDGSELWTAELNRAGRVTSTSKVAGSTSESVLQPEWSPAGELYFLSDRSGWWNLHRASGEGDEPLCRRSAEFGAPQWVFGMRFYAFAGPREIVCLYSEPGGARLGRIDVDAGTMQPVELLYANLHALSGTSS